MAATLLTGCGKQAGYGGEGHFKDACLNESYHETEMMNVKGEKVDVSSDNIFLIQKYGYGLTIRTAGRKVMQQTLLKQIFLKMEKLLSIFARRQKLIMKRKIKKWLIRLPELFFLRLL